MKKENTFRAGVEASLNCIQKLRSEYAGNEPRGKDEALMEAQSRIRRLMSFNEDEAQAMNDLRR